MTPRNKWTPVQIRRARQIALKPLLEQMGCPMQELKNDNWKVHGLSVDIVVKETYWICPDTGAGGNAIDLLVHVMDMSFSQAMDKLEAFKQP
jgi:hypothetical protein